MITFKPGKEATSFSLKLKAGRRLTTNCPNLGYG